MSQSHGTVWWSELMTRDTDAAQAYYGAVCGWRFEQVDMAEGPYILASAHGRPVAGMMDMSGFEEMAELPPHWFTYLAVDDLDAALAAATEAGGTVIRPPFEVPDTGRIALVTDVTGAAVGLMTPVSDWDMPDASGGALDNLPV